MQKSELMQIKYLKAEIELLKQRLVELREGSLMPGVRFMERVAGGRAGNPVAGHSDAADELERAIVSATNRCIAQVLRAQRYIDSVEDSGMRIMLTERYIRCKSWLQVAFAVGEYDGDCARKRVERFLRSSR